MTISESLACKQTGQAMVEFMVAASFVLIPFLFAISYLAKAGDVQHRAYEGARYAAWEQVVSDKNAIQINNEINKRILYGKHTDFDSEKDRNSNNNQLAAVDTLHHHTSNDGNYQSYLLKNNQSLVKSASTNHGPNGSAYSTRDQLLDNMMISYDLNKKGIVTASVQYQLAVTKHLALAQGLKPQAHNAIYSEAWRQVSNNAVKKSIKGAIFGEKAFNNSVFDAMAATAAMVGFEEWQQFKPGFVKPDVVSCSRVIGGGGDREKACF